jgi:ATP-dependent Clp protease protease subunit
MSSIRRDDIDRLFDYGVHVPSRTLYAGGEVDEAMAALFLKGMTLLEPGGTPILVVLNSPGGDEYHGLGVYDAIATSKCHVTVTVYGHAMSMGSWILQAADDRALAPNATVMIHRGYVPVNADLTGAQVEAMGREYRRVNTLMEQAYLRRMRVKNPKITQHQLGKLLDRESYFTANEAVELGLADRVLEVANCQK